MRNVVIKNEIPDNKNPNKIVDFLAKILGFNKESKGIRILISKLMLQGLLIVLARVKAIYWKTYFMKSENSHQKFFASSKKITKKIYNNIRNSVNL